MRAAILRHALAEDVMAAVQRDIGDDALVKLMSSPHLAIIPSVRRAGDVDVARQLLNEELGKLMARRGHSREIIDGMDDISGVADEGVTWRLARAAAAIDTSIRKETDDSVEFETAQNGVKISKDERSAFDNLLGGLSIDKAKRK
jgi:DNA primase